MATLAITPDQDAIIGEVFVAAPPARVFQALTDPEQVPRWWGQQGMYRITEWKGDVRPGGKWSSVGIGADGTSFPYGGRIPGSRSTGGTLSHTWIKSWAAAKQTIVRWELRTAMGQECVQRPEASRDGNAGENTAYRLCGPAGRR